MRLASYHTSVLAAAVIAGYGCYAVWGAFHFQRWSFGVFGGLALAAAAGVVLRQRWSRYAVGLVVAAFGVSWGHAVVTAVRAGAWAGLSPGRALLSLLPGLAMILVAVACAWVVDAHFRARGR